MNLQERIQTIISVNNHTPASFADKLGIQRSGLSHILNGRNKPSLDFIEKVLKHFPRVDAGWLITGNSPGKIQKETEQPEAITEKVPVEHKVDVPNEVEKDIERIVIFYTDRTFVAYNPKTSE